MELDFSNKEQRPRFGGLGADREFEHLSSYSPPKVDGILWLVLGQWKRK